MDNGEPNIDMMLDRQRREHDEQRQMFTTNTRSKSRGARGDRLTYRREHLRQIEGDGMDMGDPDPPMIIMVEPDTGEIHTCGRAPDNFVRYRRDDTRFTTNPALKASDRWRSIRELPDDQKAIRDGMVLIRGPVHAHEPAGLQSGIPPMQGTSYLGLAQFNGRQWFGLTEDIRRMTEFCYIPE